MIPNIQTLENIDLVLAHLARWRGAERVLLLEACDKLLRILRQKDDLDAVKFKGYNARVLPALMAAREHVLRQEGVPLQPASASSTETPATTTSGMSG